MVPWWHHHHKCGRTELLQKQSVQKKKRCGAKHVRLTFLPLAFRIVESTARIALHRTTAVNPLRAIRVSNPTARLELGPAGFAPQSPLLYVKVSTFLPVVGSTTLWKTNR